ncbi:MAG: hypothetical protein FWH27_18605, partial [Planctomycetaceae bacterium]|nr:hypothetical protein [Planctomycetaceae bacterium]
MKSSFLRLLFFALFCGYCFPPIVAQDWRLLNGTGERIPPDILQVIGDGTDTAYWHSEPVSMPMFGCYRFSVSHRGVDTNGGCLPCGVEGFSRDYSAVSNQWTDESFYFSRHINLPPVPMRVGHWESNGTFQFRDVKIEPVVPVLSEFDLPLGKIWLGHGETIRNGKYNFRSNFGGVGTNTQRPFSSTSAAFNSNRWNFGAESQLSYNFRLTTRDQVSTIPLTNGKLVINVCYHTQGEGVIEISTGGWEWSELARITKAGTLEIILPENLFPRESVLARIRGLDGCYFQIDRIDFEAPLPETYKNTDLHSLNLRGDTLFATMDVKEGSLRRYRLALTQNDEITVVGQPRDFWSASIVGPFTWDAKTIPLEKSRSPGEIETTFEFEGTTYTLTTQTHPLERSDYGYRIGEHWWCEADWKVSRDRLPPEKMPETVKPITLSAA